jgi:hypothetical protein
MELNKIFLRSIGQRHAKKKTPRIRPAAAAAAASFGSRLSPALPTWRGAAEWVDAERDYSEQRQYQWWRDDGPHATIFLVRLPRGHWMDERPELDSGLTLVRVRDHRIAVGRVEEWQFAPHRRHGYVRLSGFRETGFVLDPN